MMVSAFTIATLPWSIEDNKKFELTLAKHYRDSDRWSKIAATFPNKQLEELQRHYNLLQEDLQRIQDGGSVGEDVHDSTGRQITPGRKAAVLKRAKTQPAATGSSGSETQRKGVPWTQEEHRRFLVGLDQYGKGSWRGISRDFVLSRTPTQVASHAQKYFLRLTSLRSRRRASIHDITTTSLAASS